MEHTDVIAYLYPYEDVDGKVSDVIKANSRYVPPQLQSSSQRESTEPPEDQGVSALDYLPYLELRFSDIPRTDRGLIFGCSPNCDVVLPYRGISNYHLSLTFDKHHRLIVKDWGSLMGTQVTYNRQGRGRRRDFQWIVGDHYVPQTTNNIIITLQETISFQVIVPYHDITSPAYIHRVNRFCQGMATAEGPRNGLNISNPETRFSTGAHTSGAREVYQRERLGASRFSQGSIQQDQAWAAGEQVSPGSRLARPSIPRRGNREWPLENGYITIEGGLQIDPDDYEEMAQAAFMLQTISQDFRSK